MEKVTVPFILKKKQLKQPITMLTAYDFPFARLVDEAVIDIILVGDSLGNVVLGYDSTLPVTMEEMMHHTKAVCRAVTHALVVADMPFLSYHIDIKETLKNAGAFIKEAGAAAVKIEGGASRKMVIKELINAEIPVMGHIGLTPQSVHKFGGYKVQGKSDKAAQQLIDDALAVQEAGAFSMVLEGIPWQLAQVISQQLEIPTIGIGAGPHCDGQVLVLHDMLGISRQVPKFVKKFANLEEVITQALVTYRDQVTSGEFPALEHSYELPAHVTIPVQRNEG